MWTTKEVVIISIATGLACCFATIYTQRRIQQYIDNKVTERSINPFSKLINKEITPVGKSPQLIPVQETLVPEPSPPKTQVFHETPQGAGERWTPLPIQE